ncbi:Glycosyltransferase AglE [uncultured archaeon]|nr:Glycosyltransferase AglE [uncultured archaeon]
MNPEISVVVPAYNRPELLEKTITALAGQSMGKNGFEVILVYGGSKEVEATCKAAGKKYVNFRCLASETESPARKRNIGISAAKGGIVAFTDDDCIPEKNWLEKLSGKLGENNGLAGIEGFTFTEGKKMLYSNAPVNLKGGLFPTCNIAFRKNVLEKIGGFDEAYHFYREDTDLAFRAMEFGKIEFCPEARVLHPQRKVPLLRPVETILLLKEDVRLMKKQWGKYWKYLGNSFAKEMVKASISFMWIVGLYLIGIILSTGFSTIAIRDIGLFIAAFFAAHYIIFARGLEFTIKQLIIFSLLKFAHGILYPFALIFYWLTVKV